MYHLQPELGGVVTHKLSHGFILTEMTQLSIDHRILYRSILGVEVPYLGTQEEVLLTTHRSWQLVQIERFLLQVLEGETEFTHVEIIEVDVGHSLTTMNDTQTCMLQIQDDILDLILHGVDDVELLLTRKDREETLPSSMNLFGYLIGSRLLTATLHEYAQLTILIVGHQIEYEE